MGTRWVIEVAVACIQATLSNSDHESKTIRGRTDVTRWTNDIVKIAINQSRFYKDDSKSFVLEIR